MSLDVEFGVEPGSVLDRVIVCADVADVAAATELARDGFDVLAAVPSRVDAAGVLTGALGVPVEFSPLPLTASVDDPLVAVSVLTASGPAGSFSLRLPSRVEVPGADVVAHVDGDPVAFCLPVGRGFLTVVAGEPVGSWALAFGRGVDVPTAARWDVPVVSLAGWCPSVPVVSSVNDPALLAAAGHAGRTLPAGVYDALIDFADWGNPSGALLIRDVPVGVVPATPEHPTAGTKTDFVSEFSLLTLARMLGQPVGYAPEHGGDLVQNISPTRTGAYRQVSTSSAVVLEFHTEAAFHPVMPRYLALLCLRGDEAAATTLTSVSALLARLPADVVEVLYQPLFTTGVDESYRNASGAQLARSLPRPILSGGEPFVRLWLDNDLMQGVTPAAAAALAAAAEAARDASASVTLAAGDLLVVDNWAAVHGRSPFTPRFDGTDRWLQRVLIVGDHRVAGADLRGRIVCTEFL